MLSYKEFSGRAEINKVIINVGMPRTGTNTWTAMMRSLHQHQQVQHRSKGQFHRIFSDYKTEDLAEILLNGNKTWVDNPLMKKLSLPSAQHFDDDDGGVFLAMADHPAFLLAPIAHQFLKVHWVHVTRNLTTHVESVRYMLGEWLTDRCKCKSAPLCSSGNIALIDRLFFNVKGAVAALCKHSMDPSKIPQALLEDWLGSWERMTREFLRGHPRYIELKLEDGAEANMRKMARFLKMNDTLAVQGLDFTSFQKNERSGSD